MIIQCQSCSRKFVVKDRDIPTEGRMVQCGYCSVTWHQMPAITSGKTGLFAKKSIGKELDKLTGRKRETPVQKRQRKKKEIEINPAGKALDTPREELNNKKTSSKEGLGFFGYIFLVIIIGFSIVGMLKTFENDLINFFPETEYIFQFLDQQLEFFSETVKNMIIIVKDLINYY